MAVELKQPQYAIKQLQVRHDFAAIGMELNLTGDIKADTKPYFTKFTDMAHRADLAYAMMELAQRASRAQVYLNCLWNPAYWAWLTTDAGGSRPIFVGWLGARH